MLKLQWRYWRRRGQAPEHGAGQPNVRTGPIRLRTISVDYCIEVKETWSSWENCILSFLKIMIDDRY